MGLNIDYSCFPFLLSLPAVTGVWMSSVTIPPSQATSLFAPLPVVGVCMGRGRRAQVELSTPHLSFLPVLLGMLSCLLLKGPASPCQGRVPTEYRNTDFAGLLTTRVVPCPHHKALELGVRRC